MYTTSAWASSDSRNNCCGKCLTCDASSTYCSISIRLPFSILYSPFSILHSLFSILYSPFSIQLYRQILRVPSQPPLTSDLPSGLNATDFTASAWPERVWHNSPLLRSHIFMVSSLLPLAQFFLSGLIATDNIEFVCPVRLLIRLPVIIFQILMVLSLLPLTRV